MQNQYTEIPWLLYTKNEKSEREIKESIPFTIATKIIKCLGINLGREKKLYTENYDTNKRNQRWHKWRDITCFWIGRINSVKMAIPPNAIYRLNAIPIKLPMAFFTKIEQKFYNSYGKKKRPQKAKAVLRKKSWVEESTFLNSDYTTKHNLQIQLDPYQITNDIFHRTRTKSFTIHMETQKNPE